MKAELFPITGVPSGRLAVMPRPRAGDWLEDEIGSWKRSGIDVLVSLLEDEEVEELGLGREAAVCEQAGMAFVSFPVPDRGVPASKEGLSRLVGALVEHLREGRGVGIQCRIGVGRSALVAVCVLVALGRSPEEAWASVEEARGLSVPDTAEQREWVADWAAGFGGPSAGSSGR